MKSRFERDVIDRLDRMASAVMAMVVPKYLDGVFGSASGDRYLDKSANVSEKPQLPRTEK